MKVESTLKSPGEPFATRTRVRVRCGNGFGASPAHAPEDEALVDRLASELASQGDPAITMRRTTVLDFECATGEFMLRARVADALMRVCGHGQWQRLFRPPE